MSETVNAIQDRPSPRSIAANAADRVRTSASEKAREIADSEPVHYVRANPIPTAMVGAGIAGLAWLVLDGREARTSRRDSFRPGTRERRVGPRYYEGEEYARATYRPRYGYGDESAEVYPPGTPSPGFDAGRSSGERASSWTGGISSRAGEMADDVSRRARRTTARTRTQLQRTWNDNPLLVGAAAAVAGAIVGLAVPETDREHEWMGETRDDMIEGVQQAVRDKVEAVQETAVSALDQVKSVVGIPDEPNNEAGTAGTTATGRARKRGGPSSAGDVGNS